MIGLFRRLKVRLVSGKRLGAWFASFPILMFVASSHTQAALTTNTWQSPTPGKWEDGAHWDHGVPSITFSLCRILPEIEASANSIIDIDTAASSVGNGCLNISNLTVQGSPLIFSSTSTLLISNMNLAAGNFALIVGDMLNVNVRGNIVVTNSRLRVGSPGIFDDGLFVNGNFILRNGGELITTNSFGCIGRSGYGQMTVEGGLWDSYAISVGVGGQGSLTISGGTTIARLGLQLGESSLVAYPETGTGSLLLTGGELDTRNYGGVNQSLIGGRGAGYMTISNGLWLASDVYVDGVLTVAGGTAMLSSAPIYGNLFVGYQTNGSVLVNGGELVVTNNSTATYVGFSTIRNTTQAQMTISNGTWRAKSVYVARGDGADPSTELGSGSLTFAGGLTLVSSNFVVGNSECAGAARVDMYGGNVFITNATRNAVLDISSGWFVFHGGTLVADRLVLGACGHFAHFGGTLEAGSVVVNPYDDADGDGLPNWWEQLYGFDVLDPTTPVEDSDGDGLDNYVEYWLGSNPLDRSDPLHITGITLETNNVRVTWNYVPAPGSLFQHCTLEASSSLPGPWAPVGGTIALPSGTFILAQTNVLDPGALTNYPTRFYRVHWSP